MLDEGGIKAAMSLEEERIAEVDWQKLKSSAWKEGYREGIDKGTEEALQQGTETRNLKIKSGSTNFMSFNVTNGMNNHKPRVMSNNTISEINSMLVKINTASGSITTSSGNKIIN